MKIMKLVSQYDYFASPNIDSGMSLIQVKDKKVQEHLTFFTCVLVGRQCFNINDFIQEVAFSALKYYSNSKGLWSFIRF